MATIDFLISFPPTQLYHVASALSALGHTVGIQTGDAPLDPPIVSARLAQLNDPRIRYVDVKARLDATQVNGDFARLSERYIERYRLNSLRNFVFPHHCYNFEDERLLIQRAVHCFLTIERLFDEFDIKCLVQNGGGEILTLAAAYEARYRGIPSLFMGESLFPGRMIIYDDETGTMRFDAKPASGMSADEVAFTTDAMDQLRKRRRVVTFQDNRSLMSKVRFRAKTLAQIAAGTSSGAQIKTYVDVRRERLLRVLAKPFVYAEIDASDRIVYMPLHVEGDTQITIRNPQFYRQEFLVELLARALPEGYTLYVKEHPSVHGITLPFSSLRRIAAISNVKVLPVTVNSHDVIQSASAVAVINSSVAFEALLYGKPVIVFGNSIVRDKGVTFDVHHLADTARVVRQALTQIPDADAIRAVVFSMWQSMFEGTMLDDSEENCRKIAASLVQKARGAGAPISNTRTP